MDDNNSKSLDKYEFTKAMTDYQLGFTEGEIQKLFIYFDFDRSGSIEFDEFVRAIRGAMNDFRKAIVMKAFDHLDKDGNGWIDINDVRGVYNASKHPDVLSGKKNEDQILQEFLETFETAHSMRNNNTPNYVVTTEEFTEYYNNISASIDDDQYFALMITNAWKLDAQSRQGMGKKGWAG
jgi:Ca2+-binding EF-hand superfamily protein